MNWSAGRFRGPRWPLCRDRILTRIPYVRKRDSPVTTSKLTSKGQTTIPKDIRDQVGLQSGDRMHFSVLSNGTIVIRVKNKSIADLRGALKTRRRVSAESLNR